MRYALVETDIGTFGIAWTDKGLARVALPGRDLSTLRGYRLKVGDKLTVVAELADFERLLRTHRPVPLL